MVCEWLSALLGKKIIYHITKLPMNTMGLVFFSEKHRYHIMINKNVTCKHQKEIFFHEVKHIISDLPDGLYLIDMNMQYSRHEGEADRFAKRILNL